MKKIQVYKLNNGQIPFENWLFSLVNNLQKKVVNKLSQLENENFSNCSILRNADGVKEARIKTPSGIRIYFGEYDNQIIILLAGGDKDTQDNDIQKAKDYWQDYKLRRKK